MSVRAGIAGAAIGALVVVLFGVPVVDSILCGALTFSLMVGARLLARWRP